MTRWASAFDLLAADRLGPASRAVADRLRAAPWTRPVDGEAESGSPATEPDALAPGEVLLVSTGRRGDRAGLWHARLGRPRARSVPLVGEAREAARRAATIALRDLAMIHGGALDGGDSWSVTLIHKDGDGFDVVLDGDSFGLGFALGAASRLVGRVVPPSFAMLGCVAARGEVRGVNALDRKLDLVARWAARVTTCVVASEQLEEAERLAAGACRAIAIRGVASLSEAVDEVLGPIDETSIAKLDERDARARATGLFRLALRGSSIVSWRGVRNAAQALATSAHVRPDEPLAAQLAFAREVASRHEGSASELPWPSDPVLAAMPRPTRLRWIANVVQSASDEARPDLDEIEQRARRHVAAPNERHAEDLELLGACGRALAAGERFEDARATLTDAVDGWAELDREGESGRALCELLRVLGILTERDSVLGLLGSHVTPLLTTARGEQDEAYLRAAAARALVQVGRPDQALTLGAAFDAWDYVPSHVRVGWLRWKARAFEALGQAREAGETRASMAAEPASQDIADLCVLTEIDAALAERRSLSNLVVRLADSNYAERRRWWADDAPDWEPDRVRQLADRWRY